MITISFGSRPEEPSDGDEQLKPSSSPQGAGAPKRAMSQQAAQDGADEEEKRRGHASVPLRVVHGEQVDVREEVAVDASEDDAREGVVLEGAADDGLAAALEGDEGDGHEHGPADGRARVRVRLHEGEDRRGHEDQEHLQHKGGAEDPAPRGREVPVEEAEEDGPDAEEADRGDRLDPSGALARRRDA